MHLMGRRLFYIFSTKCGVHTKECETVGFDQPRTGGGGRSLSTVGKLYG